MKKIDYDYTIIDGNRVRVADRRKGKNGDYEGLEPSYGYYKEVVTPWGAMERCYIVTVPSLAGGKETFASVFKPVTNPGVRWSVFQVYA
jgi:hypothetical protein